MTSEPGPGGNKKEIHGSAPLWAQAAGEVPFYFVLTEFHDLN